MPHSKITIRENLDSINSIIEQQLKYSDRLAGEINLVAVSKKQPPEAIQSALDCGHRLFGENRVQEALEHWEHLKPQYGDLKLHMIGPLQSNKVKEAVSLFDVIETVDRPKLVKALAAEIKNQDKQIECYIQVNTGAEEQKSGVLPKDLSILIDCCRKNQLTVSGLMCIPPAKDPPALHFALLSKLAKQNKLQCLSMGMSNDFEKAIVLGATHIRIGTALFGTRLL